MKKDIWMDKELWSRIGDTAMKLDKALKGITKPQPLNLEKLIRKIENDLLNRDSEISDEMDALDERLMDTIQSYTDAVVSKTIEHTVNIVRQRIKFAVEGLKNELEDFKDKNPSLDTWVYSEIVKFIDKWFEGNNEAKSE